MDQASFVLLFSTPFVKRLRPKFSKALEPFPNFEHVNRTSDVTACMLQVRHMFKYLAEGRAKTASILVPHCYWMPYHTCVECRPLVCTPYSFWWEFCLGEECWIGPLNLKTKSVHSGFFTAHTLELVEKWKAIFAKMFDILKIQEILLGFKKNWNSLVYKLKNYILQKTYLQNLENKIPPTISIL